MINQRSVDHARPALAFVASVSNRVIARKLEREQKKKVDSFYFCSRPDFSRRTRAETLATQASMAHANMKIRPEFHLCVVPYYLLVNGNQQHNWGTLG